MSNGGLMSLSAAFRASIRVAALLAGGASLPLPAVAAAGEAAVQFATALRYEHAEGVPRDYRHARSDRKGSRAWDEDTTGARNVGALGAARCLACSFSLRPVSVFLMEKYSVPYN